MSALAQILNREKFYVQGSDLAENDEVKKLKKKGIKVFDCHNKNNVDGCDVVVYSSAIKDDNPELSLAKEKGLILIKRAELLGMIAESYKTVIAVAGSHGKTTTTAMLAEIFMQAGVKPTLHIGGSLKSISSNYKLGNKKFFITEACEYKDNFLYIKPDIAVVLNEDSDHLDYFGSIDGVKHSFYNFADSVRDGGIVIASGDDNNSKELFKLKNVSSFGLSKKSDLYAKNIKEYKPGYFKFDVYLCGHKLGDIELNILGQHNVYNALASVLVSIACGIDFCDIKFALENFSGVERRCEKIGSINGAVIYHDYAHHPSQIEKMIEMAKCLTKTTGGKIITVFEPHTYSRTKFLLEDFAKSFSKSDYVLFAPVYSAREDESEGKNSLELAAETEKFVEHTEYYGSYIEIENRIKKLANTDDIVLILGAGTIEHLARDFSKD